MWFVHHESLLLIFPPKELEPFVDTRYATQTGDILRQRCEVLGRYGLKGVWNANEPAVLPEAFFTAYPELRGPRIDQPNRSRKAYFAPNVDEPEMLRMYRDAMQQLLKTCPEADEFHWVTTDAGSGFDWTPSLYPGINGSSNDTTVRYRTGLRDFWSMHRKPLKMRGMRWKSISSPLSLDHG